MNFFKLLIIVFAILFNTLVSCSKGDDPFDPDPGTETPNYPKPAPADNNVVAHRGGSKENGYPDNSIAALKNTISLGCFASECDIHITKDGKVVVFHDDTFKGLVFKNATYAQLSAAGTLSNGEQLPLLEDFIDVVLNAKKTILWIDVKSMDDTYGGDEYSILAGQAAADIIRDKHAKNFVKFIVGRDVVLMKCIEATHGEWECGYMNVDASAATFYSKGYTWANFKVSKFYGNQSLIQTYKDKGIKVSTYNADTEEQMNWFLSQNMYAICTNYPQKLLNLINKD